jgi:hypothetical protein
VSIRFNADADRLVRTANLPSSLNYTAAGFVQLVNNQGNYSALFSLEENASSFQVLETDAGGAELWEFIGFSPSVELDSANALTPGTWWFVAVVHTASAVQIFTVPVGSSSFTSRSIADTTDRPPATMVLMGDSFNEPPDCRAVGWRIWDASDWTIPDLLAESASLTPVRTSNLNAYYRWLNADERLIDYGPNGYNLSEVGGGAWETEANPPGIYANVADLTSELPGLTSAMDAGVGAQADLAAELPGIASAVDAAAGVAGSFAGMVPGLSSALSVSPGVTGNLTAELPGLTSAVDLAVAPAAELAAELPGLTSAISLGHGEAAALASILPGLSSSMGLRTPIHPTATMFRAAGPSATLAKG